MAISWSAAVALANKIASDVPAIKTMLDALANMDFTGITNLPENAKRIFSVTGGVQIQKYASNAWATVGKLMHDVDTVDGKHAATGTTANTIPVRDSSGKLPGDITGNASTASKASDLADNYVVPVAKGGTEASTAAEARKNLGVMLGTTSAPGLVKPDGITAKVTEDGTITVKDVAIGGDLGDLASARGQIGDNIRINTASDLNAYTKAGNWLFSDAAAGENFPNIGRGGELNCYVSTTAIFQFFTEFNNNRRYIRYGIPNSTWTNWIQFISVAQLGDGIRNTNGIISVPEYEGATASSAGTSGLVPPAAAGQHESFLTGGGEYKPALSTGGGVMTGSIQINDLENAIGAAPSTNTERGLFLGDKNSVIMGGFDVIQRASDNAKYTQFYSKNSSGHITSIAAVTYEDGTRELVADSPLQINDIQIKQVVDGGRRVIVLSGARGNQGHSFRFSPDTGEAYMDGRVIHAKADTAGYADTAGSAPANGGTAWAANRLRREGGVDTVWNWAGQGGQPGWLWGGNDGVNMYVYNPANFSVNYANSCNYANSAGSAPANGGTAWAVTVTPNVVNVSYSALPAGGTWLVMSLDNGDGGQFQKLNFSKVAGGTRTSGLAIRIA